VVDPEAVKVTLDPRQTVAEGVTLTPIIDGKRVVDDMQPFAATPINPIQVTEEGATAVLLSESIVKLPQLVQLYD
jgi:hypothetical protein